ncbi:uncharacterized protein [Nicotiana tomentosiformis]|uniref:uncharacterized protein n=1 Tax=Nicotiana tomentosiformis TaxID=4098 RepID=UPI00388CB018
MSLALRYVDKKGQVNEPFIGLVRVTDTSAMSLKEASGEVQSEKGLNQERGLQRPGDIRWGSHCKILDNFVVLVSSIVHVLRVIECEGDVNDRLQAEAFFSQIKEFEFVFLLHLMLKVFIMLNELSKALQKKEQNIVNAMVFLDITKERLQEMRDKRWE